METVKKHLSKYNPNNPKNNLPPSLFEPYKREISDLLRARIFDKFIESEKYTRFCQWKNFELNIQVEREGNHLRSLSSSRLVNNERLQCAQNHRTRWIRRSLRMSKGGHRQNVTRRHGHSEDILSFSFFEVCYEMSRQEKNQDETRRNIGVERTNHALTRQHRGRSSFSPLLSPPLSPPLSSSFSRSRKRVVHSSSVWRTHFTPTTNSASFSI